MEQGVEVSTFEIPKGNIIIKPVMRMRNPQISDPSHEAYFLFSGSTIDYCLPMDKMGNLYNPFSSTQEKEWLEKELDLDLNYHKNKDNYWKKAKVKLGKEDTKLDLSNPKHYIQYLILKANKNFIAPSGDKMLDRATYRYAIVSEQFETRVKVSSADKKKRAYKSAAKLEAKGKQAMLDFLRVYGNKVDDGSSLDFLIGKIDDIIEDNIDKFLAITVDSENYEIKLLIAKAVDAGAVVKRGREYTLPGGDTLCEQGDVSTLDNVVEYLKATRNQDILTLLKARVDKAGE